MLTKRQRVLDLLQKHPVVRPKDLVKAGLPKDYLYQFMQKGLVVKLGRGLYQLHNKQNDTISEWRSYVEAQRQVPKGVFCLLSALVFHKFTTQNPHELWITISNKSWQPVIDYPPVRFINMSGKALDECIEVHQVEGTELRVYSVAKTVADCFKFRNQIGLDVAIEALKEGWGNQKFTVDELMEAAMICRVSKVIKPYVESIVHA